MSRAVTTMALVIALLPGPGMARLAAAQDAELDTGIRQAQEADYDTAVRTLEAAVKRLSAQPDARRDLARAQLYLGVAHHGLGQEDRARERVLEALKTDPAIEISEREFPPRVMEFFGGVMKAAGIQPRPRPTPAAEKKGGGKGLLLLGGALAVGGGVALAAGGGGSDDPPAATFPNISGSWRGDGANGQFMTGGPCTQQNALSMTINQNGGSFTGSITVTVARVGGGTGCLPASEIGRSSTLAMEGTVTTSGAITIRYPAIPAETWTGTATSARMAGDISGLPSGVMGTWSVVRP
jgi:hypothetical protein